jgi:ABC-type polysaccharide/polyol phosphate export permease
MKAILLYRELIKNLVLKDLKLKYRDSTLGFLWSLANPLLLILVYSFVFSHIIRTDLPNFSYFLLVGILPWNFFSQSLMMSTGSILENGSLIRKVALPREVFPIATVLFNLVQLLLAFAVFLPMTFLFFRLPLSWSMLAFVPILGLHVLFTLGLSFVFATATVFYRDVRHFTEIGLTLLFWLTPIVYDIRAIPDSLRMVVALNPLSSFVLSYQDVLYRGAIPGAQALLSIAILSLLSFFLGYILFSAYKARFAEEV